MNQINITEATIAKLDVKAGDTVVVTYPGKLSVEQWRCLSTILPLKLPEGVKILVLENGGDIKVIHSEQDRLTAYLDKWDALCKLALQPDTPVEVDANPETGERERMG